MPKKTFFNLNPEKQEHIINKSIEAFSNGTFKEVKVSSIIKLAEIPRASFYDYFEDKMDLYKYIMTLIAKKKNQYLVAPEETDDFFITLRKIISSGTRFMVNEPELDSISKQFLSDPNLIKEVFGENSMDVSDYLKTLLIKGIDDGHIRKDIDVVFISKSISILSSQLMLEGVKEDVSLETIIDEMSDKMINFIKVGIGC